MEALSNTTWDVLISGTGLPQSLLALALSRSGKKILHIDKNDYYGGAAAAFSLQEAEEWVKKVNKDMSTSVTFSNASVFSVVDSQAPSTSGAQLSFSRAYSLSLCPQLIYTQSALIPIMVSSKVYRQLEFQAVGSWWICRSTEDGSNGASESESTEPPKKRRKAALQRVPNAREDLISDVTLDFKAKMALVKFLNSVAKPDEAPEIESDDSEMSLSAFLESRFRIPETLHPAVHGISLSPDPIRVTKTKYALPRVRRHLRSVGVFGPGFGSVIPKWGGTAEIAQVACRAGAVGGAVYVLGRGINSISSPGQSNSAVSEDSETSEHCFEVELSDGERIRTKFIAGSADDVPIGSSASKSTESTRSISVVSSSLDNLFPTVAEGSPSPAGAVVVVPEDSWDSSSKTEENPPVYLFIHSSDTGECPVGQCVIYASTSFPAPNGHILLDHAISSLLQSVGEQTPARILWCLRYTQHGPPTTQPDLSSQPVPSVSTSGAGGRILITPPPSLDLAFDDSLLENVGEMWEAIMGPEAVEWGKFMNFEDREGIGEEENDEE